MRFSRLVTALLGAGLLSLPVVALGAAPAQAAGSFQTRITIAREPAVQLYNKPVQVGGKLESFDGATWTPVGDGETLTLERRLAGATAFVAIGTATADSEGVAIFTTTAVSNASYRVTYAGGNLSTDPSTIYLPSASGAVGVKVARNLGARKDKISGPKFRFFGKVSPKYARKKIVLQKKLGGGAWKTIGSQKTTRRSRWSFIVFARSSRGVVRYRTFTPKSTKFIKSYSATFKITTF